MYRRLGKYELALADFSESLRYDPQSALATPVAANAYRACDSSKQSIADHTEALRLKPDDAASYNNRGNTCRISRTTTAPSPITTWAIKFDPRIMPGLLTKSQVLISARAENKAC